MSSLLILLTLLLSPSIALAADTQAGTDQYLREVAGWTNDMLTNGMATEARQAFSFSEGVAQIDDPLGDVLTRLGTTTTLTRPWADIQSVTTTRDETAQEWNMRIVTSGTIPHDPSEKIQLFIYADIDGDTTNNMPGSGIRAGSDAEFSVQHNTETGWYTDFRWYNPAADFWAVNKNTAMTFTVEPDGFSLRIPFAEIPSEQASWRVVLALSAEGTTEIDAAPGVGFPPPTVTPEPTTPAPSTTTATSPSFLRGVLLGTGALLLIGGVSFVLWKRRR